MHAIRQSRIGTALVTFLAALILFSALAVSYDVSTSDGGGAVAEAHTNYYCGHGTDYKWVSGAHWRVEWRWSWDYEGNHYHVYYHYRWNTRMHANSKWCGLS